MKEIEINSKKYGVHKVLVDDEDYDELIKYKWGLVKSRYTFYAECRSSGYTNMHRMIMNLCDCKLLVDHIDCNGLNNQKSNLRICTIAENNKNVCANRPQTTNSTSKYKGVSWDTQKRKWRVCISINNKNTTIGRFNNEIDAAIAYNNAALEYHGEFANLNTIEN